MTIKKKISFRFMKLLLGIRLSQTGERLGWTYSYSRGRQSSFTRGSIKAINCVGGPRTFFHSGQN